VQALLLALDDLADREEAQLVAFRRQRLCDLAARLSVAREVDDPATSL
jgi:hypothetical protein